MKYIILLLVLTIIFSYISFMIFMSYYLFRELKQAFSGYGVPFVPSTDNKISGVIESLRFKKWETLIDIGCGDGKMLYLTEKAFPSKNLIGFEKSSYPFSLALKRKLHSNCKYNIYKKDFFHENLKDADIIYCYLFSYLMKKVWNKIKKECKKGTILYSNSFSIPGVEPIETIFFEREQKVYVYLLE